MTTHSHTGPIEGLPSVVRTALIRMLADPDLVRDLADAELRGQRIAELGLANVPLPDLRTVIVARTGPGPGITEEARA
jgi:hypothetical protein